MAQGGFLIKFDDQEAVRCVEATFQYDTWRYITNGREWQEIPKGTKTITVEVIEGTATSFDLDKKVW